MPHELASRRRWWLWRWSVTVAPKTTPVPGGSGRVCLPAELAAVVGECADHVNRWLVVYPKRWLRVNQTTTNEVPQTAARVALPSLPLILLPSFSLHLRALCVCPCNTMVACISVCVHEERTQAKTAGSAQHHQAIATPRHSQSCSGGSRGCPA